MAFYQVTLLICVILAMILYETWFPPTVETKGTKVTPKIRWYKCKRCEAHVQPYQEDLIEIRQSCDMGGGCGLGTWNPTLLPKRPTAIVIPILSKQKLPALLEAPKPPEKAPKTHATLTEDDGVVIEISDPLYFHIGKKNNVRYLDVK